MPYFVFISKPRACKGLSIFPKMQTVNHFFFIEYPLSFFMVNKMKHLFPNFS